MKYCWWWREFRRSPATLYKPKNRGIFTTNPSTGWCCSPDFQTNNRKGWSSSNRIFFPEAMYVNFRKATKVLTYQKGMKSDQIIIFHQPPHWLRHGHAEIHISPTWIFFPERRGGPISLPKKLCPGRVWGRYNLTSASLAFRVSFLRLAELPGKPGLLNRDFGLKPFGCPRKLGSMVSKWVITLVYSIYR